MHVLCVDDDRVNRLLLELLLAQVGGLSLACAESGADALAQAREQPPDLLIVDLHLPDTNGLQLLPRLREAAGRADLAAVLCTAENPEDVMTLALAAGFHQTWTKPVTIEHLRDALARLSTTGTLAP
jgi:two-component system, OmpR family, response regulator